MDIKINNKGGWTIPPKSVMLNQKSVPPFSQIGDEFMWEWNYSDQEVSAEKILHILVDKNRDCEIRPFDLKEQFEVMRVTNMEGNTF
jgi:hypothetical protein